MIIHEILTWLNQNGYDYSFTGNKQYDVSGFASLNMCTENDITWVKKREIYDTSDNSSNVQVAVVQKGLELAIPNQIIAHNSKEVFFAILHHFWGKETQYGFRGTGTFISSEVQIDESVYIGHNCTIIGNIRIGANTIIENNVSISNDVTMGTDCLIHSGVVIGADGFGFAFGEDGLPIKVEHFGGVTIGNRVEIGANTCIDRGTIDRTIIQDDVKIDNLVHIAHNVILKQGAVVVAGAIICGSAQLGENSYVAPGGIVKNQLIIGNSALVGLGAVVTKPVDKSSVVAGIPAKEIRKVKAGDK